MSVDISSDDDYLPPKYPNSGNFLKKISAWKVSKEDAESAGNSKQINNFEKNVKNISNITCMDCDKFFKNEHGLKIHNSKIHKHLPKDSFCNQEDTSQNFCQNKDIIHNIPRTNSLEFLKESLIKAKSNTRTLRRIPKGARYSVADKFCSIANKCISLNSISAWSDLLLFAYKIFNISENKKKMFLSSKIKENVNKFEISNHPSKKINNEFSLSKRVEAKVNDFDIKGAIRIISSNDTFAPFDINTLNILKSKHPSPPQNLVYPSVNIKDSPSLSVTEIDVSKAINSFPCGSAAGIDGFRPQFLKDIISVSAGEAGKRALSSLTQLCNFLLSGKVINEICPILYGASLCAFLKKDGGIRPIAVGSVFRRLSAKMSCFQVKSDLLSYLSPNQLGVATKLGSESCIHAVRTFVHLPENAKKILLKIDFSNAFNSINRDSMLNQVLEKVPSLYPFLSQCYRNPSHLFFGNNIIPSEVGCQQGDPCGPMLFSLTIHPLVKSITSDLNVWYLDDATLADTPENVLENFKIIVKMAKEIGLQINPSKCELFFCSGSIDQEIVNNFETITPGIRIVNNAELELLGSPIFDDGIEFFFKKKTEKLLILLKNVEKLNTHIAYYLTKNCLFIPKFTYFLRTCPVWKFPNILNSLDIYLRNSLETILNIVLTESQWIVASLPISKGGLGIRKISDIALPAFLASIHGVHNQVSQFLCKTDHMVSVHLTDEALESWGLLNGEIIPVVKHLQKNWDLINITRIKNEIVLLVLDKIEKARLLALQQPESGAWLYAIPSPNIGTFMDNRTFQTCVALRLGCEIFEPHICHCKALVCKDGRHGLSCPQSKGRFPRHSEINQIVLRALASIHIPSSLEPFGLSRDDGKRPDGATLIPWSKGQRLVWDATCVDTFADSYLTKTSKVAGSAAEEAHKRKHSKYQCLKSKLYMFKALAFETLGPWCVESKDFINTIGNLLIKETGDIRAKFFLYQRLSLAIQRGNAASILGTLPNSTQLDEIFVL